MRVTIYSKPDCQPCRLTKRRFEKLDIPFDEVLLDSALALAYVQSLGYSSAPVVEVELGDGAQWHWSGFRPDHIGQLSSTFSDCRD